MAGKMHILTALLSQLLLILFIFGEASAQNGVPDVCIDTNTNKTYRLGESWMIQEECVKYSCNKIAVPNMENFALPTLVKYVCTDPKPPDNDMRNCHAIVPYPKDPYPKCCSHLVCNRPGYQQIIKPQY